MAEFIELHKKSLMDEKTFAVLQNVNNISEICETPRREALISLRNNPVAGYYDRFETVETYEQIKQLLSECGSIAAADVARWCMDGVLFALGEKSLLKTATTAILLKLMQSKEKCRSGKGILA